MHKGFIHELMKNKVLYLMFVPIAIYFIVFNYYPMAGIIVAFKNFNYSGGMFGSPWVGWDNFEYFFGSGKAWLVTRNTFLYNIVFLAAYTFFSILVAVLISEMAGKIFKKTAQTLLFLPYFLSWVAVAAIVYNLFNYEFGVINTLLKNMGIEPIDIYSNVSYWYFILPFSTFGNGSVSEAFCTFRRLWGWITRLTKRRRSTGRTFSRESVT